MQPMPPVLPAGEQDLRRRRARSLRIRPGRHSMNKLPALATRLVLGCFLFAGCAKPSPAAPGGASIHKLEALGALMKNEINPAFSKLSFLLAHADAMDEDPRAVRAE